MGEQPCERCFLLFCLRFVHYQGWKAGIGAFFGIAVTSGEQGRFLQGSDVLWEAPVYFIKTGKRSEAICLDNADSFRNLAS